MCDRRERCIQCTIVLINIHVYVHRWIFPFIYPTKQTHNNNVSTFFPFESRFVIEFRSIHSFFWDNALITPTHSLLLLGTDSMESSLLESAIFFSYIALCECILANKFNRIPIFVLSWNLWHLLIHMKLEIWNLKFDFNGTMGNDANQNNHNSNIKTLNNGKRFFFLCLSYFYCCYILLMTIMAATTKKHSSC